MRNQQISIFIIILLHTTLFFVSCVDEGDDTKKSIFVAVDLSIGVVACETPGGYTDLGSYSAPSKSYIVHVEIRKSGATKFAEDRSVNIAASHFRHTVELYKEQTVDVLAYLPYPLDHVSIKQRLNWNQVYPATDWGKTYHWYPGLILCAEEED